MGHWHGRSHCLQPLGVVACGKRASPWLISCESVAALANGFSVSIPFTLPLQGGMRWQLKRRAGARPREWLPGRLSAPPRMCHPPQVWAGPSGPWLRRAGELAVCLFPSLLTALSPSMSVSPTC